MADTLELTSTDPGGAITVYNSVSGAKEGVSGNGCSEREGAVAVYMPESDSCGFYCLTDGRGYISTEQAHGKDRKVSSVPCLEQRLKSLVAQCEECIRTNLPYRPVHFNLSGPGQMELKIDLPEVENCPCIEPIM